MTEAEQIQLLKETASKMLSAYDEAIKARTSQSKWAVFNGYRHKMKELLEGKEKKKESEQAKFNWLAQ